MMSPRSVRLVTTHISLIVSTKKRIWGMIRRTSDSLYCMQSSGHNKVLWMFFVIDDRSYLEVQTVFM